ncbi:hypothetical protein MAR_017238 [Mya arenaria]|uniref:Uncharacterized protein n=1 Tax=Mya arenaria TaxID=6604 RepID=A0ABY7EB63_MYAAR|nr:hypothetical protein MAR_017238 [Mya arenaria]
METPCIDTVDLAEFPKEIHFKQSVCSWIMAYQTLRKRMDLVIAFEIEIINVHVLFISVIILIFVNELICFVLCDIAIFHRDVCKLVFNILTNGNGKITCAVYLQIYLLFNLDLFEFCYNLHVCFIECIHTLLFVCFEWKTETC